MPKKDSSINLSRIEKSEILEILNVLKRNPLIDVSEIRKIESSIRKNRYGLNFEEHLEKSDTLLDESIPVLKNVPKNNIFNPDIKDNNFLIEGDNLYSLNILKKTHKNKFSGILIDPPYNTLKDGFSYSDSKVDKKDGFRHSKWLSFMKKRLLIAHELLRNDGLIFINIDEHEFAQLKLLCDDIFGEYNFIENFIWVKNSTKNNSTTTSTNHEYILCYAKNIHSIKADSKVLRIKKEGFDEIRDIRNEFLSKNANQGTPQELQNIIRTYYKNNPHLKGISSYNFVDENFNIYTSSDISAPGGNGGDFDIVHPVTKKVCKKSNRGWGYSKLEIDNLISRGRILFGKNENKVPRFKRFLDDVETDVCKSIIINHDDGEKELQSIFELKKSPFTNPKPVSLIKYLLTLINKKNGVFLDFFAGSGTLGQAIAELNKEDGGTRKFVLCTNNEGDNICEKVTLERLKRVVNGGSYRKETVSILLEHEFKTSNIKDASLIWDKVDELKRLYKNSYDSYSVELNNNVLVLKGISNYIENKPRLNCNISYYRIELLSQEEENDSLSLSDSMCMHIKNMIQIEHHIDLNNLSVLVVLNDKDLENLTKLMVSGEKINKVYKHDDILFNKEHEAFFLENNVDIEIIPEYFFRRGNLC